MPTDCDLMRQITERVSPLAEEAFETLYARYSEPIRIHLARTVRDADGADDLVQEAFLRVWTRAEQWNGTGSVKAWLYRIATNQAFNYLRTANRHRHKPLEPRSGADADGGEEISMPGWLMDASSLGPDEVAEQIERHDILRGLVRALPEDKREVLRLVHEDDLGLRAAAERLGIPEGTVKSRLHYATRQLARQWKEIEPED